MTMIALGSLIQSQNIAAFLLCLVLLAVVFRYITRPSGLPLPPGPFKDNFFLGNSIPTSLYVIQFTTYSMLALTCKLHG